MKICSVDGCGKKHCARGLCKMHYDQHKRPRKLSLCIVDGCERHTRHSSGKCSLHRRVKKGYNFPHGQDHWSWKGGIAEYPNHYLMKRLRLAKLQSVNYVCEICGGVAVEIHHKDKDKSHHEIGNFVAVCHKCHIGCFHREDVGRPRKVVNE